uniref:Uncharacterized protein n=1 Tax=viral metagenome TaxID=1070528 RepID=A0A6M3J5I4_9ZZZZ
MYIPDLRADRQRGFSMERYTDEPRYFAAGGTEQVQAYYERLMMLKDKLVLNADKLAQAKMKLQTTPSWNFPMRIYWQAVVDDGEVIVAGLEEQYQKALEEYNQVSTTYTEVEEKGNIETTTNLTKYAVFGVIGLVVFIVINKLLK